MTTIAHLIAAAHVHRSAIGGDYGFTIARKALFRITEQTGDLPTRVPAGGALEAHAALRDRLDLTPKTFQEEHNALRRLVELPEACTLPTDTALRIFQGEATLADALIAVDAQSAPDRWATYRSALVRFIAKVSAQTTGADVLAIERVVETKLGGLGRHDFGVASNSFRTLKSQIRAACALADMHGSQRLSSSMLTGRWAEATGQANAMKTKDAATSQATKTAIGTALGKVWPLVDYAWRNGIDADAVDDATVAALQADLAARQIASPLATARNAVYGWEKLQAIVPAWPQTHLNRVYQDPSTVSPHAIDFDALPAPLRAAWDAYTAEVFTDAQGDGIAWAKNQLAQMADQGAAVADPFAAHLDRIRQDAPGDPDACVADTRKSGLNNFRTVFLYAANAAIGDLGLQPTTLAEIFVPDVLAKVLLRRLERQRARAAARGATPPDPKNGTLKGTVAIFKAIARDIDQPEMTVTAIDRFYDVAHPDFLQWRKVNGQKVRLYKSRSMGPSHAAMLAQFDTDGGDRKLLAWFELPQVLHERVRARLRAVGGDPDRLSQEDFCDAITAAVAAITRSCPLRRENVGELRIAYAEAKGLGANLALPNEPGRRGRIRLWAGEVKRGTDDVSVFLTPYATEIVRFYLKVIRPALARRLGADAQNPWLFPAYGMKHRALELITLHFAKRCADAGIHMDLHANRHLTAKIVLDRDINAMPLMQQILGHKQLSMTEDYYTDIKKAFVDAQFQAHLDAKEQEVRKGLLAQLKKAS